MALVFGTYILVRARNLPSFLFFTICATFTFWCAFDLSAWFAFLGSANTMFTWSLLDFMGVLMFLFTYYFLFTFLTGRDLPLWQKILGFLLIVPSATIAFFGWNIPTYDLNACAALENSSFTIYTYYSEAIFIIATIVFLVVNYVKNKEKIARTQTLLAGTGALIFLIFFFSANFLVSLYAASSISTYVYNYLIYGLFGMPIFLIYLGYLIVRYKVFNLKMFGAQALVLALIVVLASEYAFVNTVTNRILVTVTLILTIIAGAILIRSVRKEIEQREHIEKLASDLEKANKQQVVLIHFITHQIKGFLTKSRNIFSMAVEGEFGPLPEAFLPMAQEGLRSDTQAVTTVQEILNASNVKSGAVTYSMQPFDFGALVKEVFDGLKPAADAKKLELTLEEGDGPNTLNGDKLQLQNAIKNLIDNSIKYTPSGSVSLKLAKENAKENQSLRLTIQDTGVGITPEDMAHLFTEGGHGKDSIKVNVDSTGFGLYIVKNIIEAHHGKVWVESEGAGKGSTFIVELPTNLEVTAMPVGS
jgi:signal transduction histidine kinase